MKAEIKGNKIELDMYDLFTDLPKEEQLALAHHLAIEDDIVKQVVELLTKGQTDNGSWTGHVSNDAVEQARAAIVEHAKLAASEVVRNLITDRNKAEEDARRNSDWAWKLWHQWPEAHLNRRPDNPPLPSLSEYGKLWASQADVEKAIEASK